MINTTHCRDHYNLIVGLVVLMQVVALTVPRKREREEGPEEGLQLGDINEYGEARNREAESMLVYLTWDQVREQCTKDATAEIPRLQTPFHL